MRRFVLTAGLVLVATPALAGDKAAAKAVFDAWVERTGSFDPSAAELLSDDAVLSRTRTARDGSLSELTLTGAQFKEVVTDAMAAAQASHAVDTYTRIKLTPEGEGYRVSAVRTSAATCTSDSAFTADIAPDGDDAWHIVAMHTVSPAYSACVDAGSPLHQDLIALQANLASKLPLTVDEGTELVAVDVDDEVLTYRQRLLDVATSEGPVDVDTLTRRVLDATCGSKPLVALLNRGATVRYALIDRDGVALAALPDVVCEEPVSP